jgi:heme-degrading monooxygenase HmoA
MMFARVMSAELARGLIDEAAAEWQLHIAPFKQSGLERAYMLVDRATGKYLSITIWESEAAQRVNATSPGQIAGRKAMTEKYFKASPEAAGYEIVAAVE